MAMSSTPAAVLFPPATRSPRPSIHAAAAPRRGAVSVRKVPTPLGSIFKTDVVGAPVVLGAPTMYDDPSAAVSVTPPCTSAKLPPAGTLAATPTELERS